MFSHLKSSYIHPTQKFLKYFYTYVKQKSLKPSFVYSCEKVMCTVANRKAPVNLYL